MVIHYLFNNMVIKIFALKNFKINIHHSFLLLKGVANLKAFGSSICNKEQISYFMLFS